MHLEQAKRGAGSMRWRTIQAMIFLGTIGLAPTLAAQEPQENEAQVRTLREALRASTMTAPVRENHVYGSLAFVHGSQVQALRILWWASESEPALRKEIVRQWINDTSPTPSSEEVKRKFSALAAHFIPEIQERRNHEIEEVLGRLDQDPEKMRLVKRPDQQLEGASGIEALDALDEGMLFSPGSDEWQAMIHALPECRDLENGDDYNGSVYLHLWTIAPLLLDNDIEKKLTEQALKKFPPMDRHRLLPWVMEERLRELPPALQAARTTALNAAKERNRQELEERALTGAGS